MSDRFCDNGESVDSFINQVLVKCPVCHKCAFGFMNPSKIVCHECGYLKDSGISSYGNGSFNGEELWLQTKCCSNKLWAYNIDHLDFLEQYVGATLRERKPNVNQSIASRLPTWMKKSSNREKILKAIKDLREKLINT